MDYPPSIDHFQNILDILSSAEGIITSDDPQCSIHMGHVGFTHQMVVDQHRQQHQTSRDYDWKSLMSKSEMMMLEPTPMAPSCFMKSFPPVTPSSVLSSYGDQHHHQQIHYAPSNKNNSDAGSFPHSSCDVFSVAETIPPADRSIFASTTASSLTPSTNAVEQMVTLSSCLNNINNVDQQQMVMNTSSLVSYMNNDAAHNDDDASVTDTTQEQMSNRKFQAEQWNERFQELLAFREHHGHLFVPHSYPSNQQLAQWVKRYATILDSSALGLHRPGDVDWTILIFFISTQRHILTYRYY
jgi:hypothetical protein